MVKSLLDHHDSATLAGCIAVIQRNVFESSRTGGVRQTSTTACTEVIVLQADERS